VAIVLKAINFFIYRSVLCYECEIADDLEMVHMGIGSVVHPNVTIGRRVKMFHQVTLAAETLPGSESRIVIEDDVVIGAYAIVLGNDRGGIRIGRGAIIGAGAIVNRSVAPGLAVIAMPDRAVKPVKDYST